MNKIFTMPDGLRVAYTYNPHVHSVCWGVFVGVGSSHETAETSGISHLIEHMCFKGTTTRSAFDIVSETEALGAQINAFTTKEQTAYHIRCVDTRLEPSVEILADVVLHSTFAEDALESEKQVVLEEIAMCEDTPDDLAGDLAAEAFWVEDSLSRPILGTQETVSSFCRSQLVAHVARYYVAGNVVLSVVGNVEEEEMLRLVRKYFNFPAGDVSHDVCLSPRGHAQLYRHKDVEQCNLILAFDGIPRYDDDTYALMVLDEVLGGGMSSILFQRVREELSLAYSVYSYSSQYDGRGCFGIYLGTAPAKLALAVRTVADIIADVVRQGITPEQLERGRNQSLSTYVFAAESSSSIMRAQARRLMFRGATFDSDEEIDKLNQVTLEQVNALARRLFAAAPAAGLVAKENMDCIGYFDGK